MSGMEFAVLLPLLRSSSCSAVLPGVLTSRMATSVNQVVSPVSRDRQRHPTSGSHAGTAPRQNSRVLIELPDASGSSRPVEDSKGLSRDTRGRASDGTIYLISRQGQDWLRILPELIMLGTALLRAAAGSRAGGEAQELAGPAGLLGVIAAMVVTAVMMTTGDHRAAFDNMIYSDRRRSLPISLLASLSAWGCSSHLATSSARASLQQGEYYALLLLAAAGMMVMASAANLMIIFVGLEVLSLALYVLSAFVVSQVSLAGSGHEVLHPQLFRLRHSCSMAWRSPTARPALPAWRAFARFLPCIPSSPPPALDRCSWPPSDSWRSASASRWRRFPSRPGLLMSMSARLPR